MENKNLGKSTSSGEELGIPESPREEPEPGSEQVHVKTNRLARTSAILGIILFPAAICAAASLIWAFLVIMNYKEEPADIIAGLIIYIVPPLILALLISALATGVIALIQIKRSGGREKGGGLAWIGIAPLALILTFVGVRTAPYAIGLLAFRAQSGYEAFYNSVARPASIPPRNEIGQVVFVSSSDGNPEIYLINADGTGLTNLTNNSAEDSDPVWSPDGSQLAFVSDRDGEDQIYLMGADGSIPTPLTHSVGGASDPSWSPDGAKIAFVANYDTIYVMNSDGSDQTRLGVPDGKVNAWKPIWSPDGKKLAWGWSGVGINVLDTDSSGETRLIVPSSGGASPDSWSPDVAKIAFDQITDAGFTMYTVDADGSNLTRLGAGIDPIWSPDGQHIAYSTGDGENEVIDVMSADGRNMTQLTGGTSPSWSPDGNKIAFFSVDLFGPVCVIGVDGNNETCFKGTHVAYKGQPAQWRP